MNRAIVLAALLATALPCFAQEPPRSTDFQTGEINLGLFQVDVDTLSSKFLEYRDVPNGVVAPFFRIFGQKDQLRYDFVGETVRQEDQRYRFSLETSSFRIRGDYNKIPHRFGNKGISLLQPTAPGVLELSDTLQRDFQNAIESQFAASRAGVSFDFLRSLVAPSLAAGNTVDLNLVRERANLDLALTPDRPYDIQLTYFREKRTGDRAASGTSFGFNNLVETPEPVDYLTQDIGATAELERSWGVIRAAAHYNWFDNNIPTQAFDNPFRAVDSTDPSSYLGPSVTSINGPSRGLIALPPNNRALNGSIGTSLRLAANTRISADLTLGRWMQDESDFMPYTTNQTIISPFRAADISTLPARRLDGRINVSSQAVSLSSRPADRFSVRARFRRYDLDNKTDRIEFPGYGRFDAVWEDIPRISVPYGYTTNRFDVSASYDLDPVTLEGGYKFQSFDRNFRETEKTTENGWSVAANLRARGWILLRASYEQSSRDFDEYDFARSEEASRLEHGLPSNLPELRRFDQAEKDVNRFGAQAQLTPGGNVTLALSYLNNRDDYPSTSYGLIKASGDSFSADVDYSPADRSSVYGFYSLDKFSTFQRGRQSGGVISTNVLDDWTADVEDEVESFGAGASFSLVPDKVQLRLSGRYQEVDGNNDLESPPGGTPDIAFDISDFDDTKLFTVLAELEYKFAQTWSFAVGAWFEDYEIRDSLTSGLFNYVPGSFFLVANDGDYQATVGYLRISYRW